MRPIDIRQYKNELRASIKQSRKELPALEKEALDAGVTKNVFRLYQYRSAKTLLIYVSTDIEVDTFKIIEGALKDGKKVAVPRCIPNTRLMEFHYIDSIEQLSPGTFGVLEPKETLPIVEDFEGCLMLLPALALDYSGYRLGYGKGYYDRYLSRFTGACVGMCYSYNLRRHMYHGRYDRPVDVIVTEKAIKTVSNIRRQNRMKFQNR